MFSIRLNLLLKVFPQGVRQQVHQEDNEYQHQCRAVGNGKLRFHIGAAGRDDVEVIRKRHALVEDTCRQLWQEVGGTGEKDGCRLARNTPQRQNQSGDDIGYPHRQDDMPDGLKLGSSQRAASLTHAVGDGFQRFFRGADNQRQT